MQQYSDRLGHRENYIAELTEIKSEITKDKELLNKEVADLTAKVYEVKKARDNASKEKATIKELTSG